MVHHIPLGFAERQTLFRSGGSGVLGQAMVADSSHCAGVQIMESTFHAPETLNPLNHQGPLKKRNVPHYL